MMLMLNQHTEHRTNVRCVPIAKMDNIEVYIDWYNKVCMFKSYGYVILPSPILGIIKDKNNRIDKIHIWYPVHWPIRFIKPVVLWENVRYRYASFVYYDNHCDFYDNQIDDYYENTVRVDWMFVEMYPQHIDDMIAYESMKIDCVSPDLPGGAEAIQNLSSRIKGFTQGK